MQNKILSTGNILFICSIMVFLTCQKPENSTSDTSTVFVKTRQVKKKYIAFPIYAHGVLASPQETKLSFKVGGIIEALLVDEGERVEKGRYLAHLEKSEIEAMAKQARSAYEKAERDYQRVSSLYQDSVATLEQKQDSETALKVARSNKEIAEFNLKYASIVAPAKGKILKRMAEMNELVGPGTPVFIFGSTEGAWIIRTGVSDRDIIRLQYGDSAAVYFDAYPNQQFIARVTEIAQAADPYTGTFEIELTLEGEHQNLVFGFVADIEIFPTRGNNYYLIPVEALAEADANVGTVYCIDTESKTARKISVEIARVFDGQVAILSGLEEGKVVITEGSAYLRDGSQIEMISEQQTTQSEGE
jgi:RND family efflux transporter MFP subunit